MASVHNLSILIQYIYVFMELPPILVVIINAISFITLRRCYQGLDRSAPFRKDIALGLAIGAAINVVADNAIILAPSTGFICRLVNLSAHVSVMVVGVFVLLSALCRYVEVCDSQHRCATLLMSCSNLNIFVWPASIVLNLPHLLAYSVTDFEGISFCYVSHNEELHRLLVIAVYTSPLMGYFLLTSLLTRNLDTAETNAAKPPSLRHQRFCQGTAIVNAIGIGYAIIFLPLMIVIGVTQGWADEFAVIQVEVVLSVFAIVEPLCFGFLDETFRDGFRLPFLQGDKKKQYPSYDITASSFDTPVALTLTN